MVVGWLYIIECCVQVCVFLLSFDINCFVAIREIVMGFFLKNIPHSHLSVLTKCLNSWTAFIELFGLPLLVNIQVGHLFHVADCKLFL